MQYVGVAWRVLAVLVGVYLLLLLLAWIFQRQLLYFPDRSAPTAPPGVQEVHYTTDDDLELTGWFLTPESRPPYATVVVSGGNGGHRADRLPLAVELTARGYAVLLMDYRGYGGNPGSPSEDGLIADHRAAVSYVLDRPDVDPTRLVYFGESLGTGVAAARAAEQPPAALILRSPFPELADVGQ
ncbi:MAG: alpha/beta hydrolase, partial [Nocardioidaceae bacterium]